MFYSLGAIKTHETHMKTITVHREMPFLLLGWEFVFCSFDDEHYADPAEVRPALELPGAPLGTQTTPGFSFSAGLPSSTAPFSPGRRLSD